MWVSLASSTLSNFRPNVVEHINADRRRQVASFAITVYPSDQGWHGDVFMASDVEHPKPKYVFQRQASLTAVDKYRVFVYGGFLH